MEIGLSIGLKMNKSFKINEKEIEGVFIIAEISGNHLQDFENAKNLVRVACESGADAVKLQTYTPDTITINLQGVNDEIIKKYFVVNIDNPIWKGMTYYDLYKTAYTPWEWFSELKKITDEWGVELFSTPFDEGAVDFLEAQGVNLYKVSSFDVINVPLLKKIAQTGKPVIMSVGMAGLDEIETAYEILKDNGVALLHCNSSYPVKYDKLNLATIEDLKKRFNCVVGFSDHSLTTDAPAMAVKLGAKIIEKHVCLDRSFGGPDAAFSLQPEEFKELVDRIKNKNYESEHFDEAYGQVHYGLQKGDSSEARPSIWINKDMKAGEIFSRQNLKVARPNSKEGVLPKFFEVILGKKTNQDVLKGLPFSWEFVDRDKE